MEHIDDKANPSEQSQESQIGQAEAKDYYARFGGDPEIELAESYYHFNRTSGPDSLPGS